MITPVKLKPLKMTNSRVFSLAHVPSDMMKLEEFMTHTAVH